MRKFLLVLVVLTIFSFCAKAEAGYYDIDDFIGYSIENSITNYWYSDDVTAEKTSDGSTTKGFLEFNLAEWYALNIDSSNIKSITLYSSWELGNGVGIELYSMDGNDDGVIYKGSDFLYYSYWTAETYITDMLQIESGLDVTSVVLADIENSNKSWSGFSLQASEFTLAQLSKDAAKLRITYTPEPVSFLLFSIGIGFFGLRNKKQ